MSAKKAMLVDAAIGLVIAVGILILLGIGIAGVLSVGGIDLMYVLRPSAEMLLVGWRTTPTGLAITVCSVISNCLWYAAMALLIRTIVYWAVNRSTRS
jgi:hypothetical protein